MRIKIKHILKSDESIIGKKIKVNDAGKVILGTVIDIDENGYIILQTRKETIRIISGDTIYL